jgi:hypothetical protein
VDQAREIAAEKAGGLSRAAGFELAKAHPLKISGYATPKSSLVAISFEAAFDLQRNIVEDGAEARQEATMTLKGVCSYDPTMKGLSEIEIREWRKSLKSSAGSSWGTMSPYRPAMERQYGPGKMRFIV